MLRIQGAGLKQFDTVRLDFHHAPDGNRVYDRTISHSHEATPTTILLVESTERIPLSRTLATQPDPETALTDLLHDLPWLLENRYAKFVPAEQA